MSFRLNTNISDKRAEQMGADVSREQFERYMNRFVPAENAMIGSLGSGDGMKAAQGHQAGAERARAALDRMRSRYGTELTGDQQQGEARQFGAATRLGGLTARNAGRQADDDRDFNLRGTLLNVGNNISSSAMAGLTDSSANAAGRSQAHQQAQSQAQAQRSQANAAAKSQKYANQASIVQTGATLAALAFM